MPGDAYSLSNPNYWLCGLVIFGAGLWTGRAVALRLMSPGSWRGVAVTVLIFVGTLALATRTQLPPPMVTAQSVMVTPNNPYGAGGGAYARPNPGGAMIPGDAAVGPAEPTCSAGPVLVSVDAANVRSSPSIAASVLEQVKYGTELQITGQSADWFKVKLPDQSEGWVAAGWVTPCANRSP